MHGCCGGCLNSTHLSILSASLPKSELSGVLWYQVCSSGVSLQFRVLKLGFYSHFPQQDQHIHCAFLHLHLWQINSK